MNEIKSVITEISNFFKKKPDYKVLHDDESVSVYYSNDSYPSISVKSYYLIGQEGFDVAFSFGDGQDLQLNFTSGSNGPVLSGQHSNQSLETILNEVLLITKSHIDYLRN
jgi:hypothetical protein